MAFLTVWFVARSSALLFMVIVMAMATDTCVTACLSTTAGNGHSPRHLHSLTISLMSSRGSMLTVWRLIESHWFADSSPTNCIDCSANGQVAKQTNGKTISENMFSGQDPECSIIVCSSSPPPRLTTSAWSLFIVAHNTQDSVRLTAIRLN